MKKVKHILSSVCDKFAAKKCVAAFSAAVVALSAATCAVHFASDTKVSARAIQNDGSQKMILELSESFLSPNSNTNISVLEALSDISSAEEESESIDLIEELSTGSESDKKSNREVETAETTTAVTTVEQIVETTTRAEVTTTENYVTEVTGTPESGYTFYELGLTQMSDIPVPDSIRFDANGIPLNYRYKLSGKTTTYTMGYMTATGTPVHPGVVAVNPNIIPYGTKMYIVANDGSGHVYGYSSAEDTGGFIYMSNGPLVDMYVNSYSDSCYWGNKPVDIYIF